MKLLEEPPNTCKRATTSPRDIRHPLHKFIDRRELLPEGVFDPVFDLWCDFIVLGRLVGEGDEKRADLRANRSFAIVVAWLI